MFFCFRPFLLCKHKNDILNAYVILFMTYFPKIKLNVTHGIRDGHYMKKVDYSFPGPRKQIRRHDSRLLWGQGASASGGLSRPTFYFKSPKFYKIRKTQFFRQS
ncbi:hypothetical protein GWI33_016605 [Rhynchophorus ferrugineus]|uniref:Uncharacterized protein n=1 Tax=Rhynchophorus ferrugineus TaxID=354439 RepID=A0A834I0Z1_RHYFE|nr:hypothetical protein GWI33_016605 [Rhynchophorus ferrugineus]